MSNLQTTLISGDVYIQSSLDVGVYGSGNLNIDGILTCSSISGSWTGGTISVTQGGTGLTSLTLNSVLLGNGTSNIQTPSNFTFDGTSVSLPKIISTDTTDSTSISTGAVTLAGGLGITKTVYIGNNLNISGNINSGTWNGTTISVAKGGTGVTTSTGSGSVVLSTSPTLVTPVLGIATGTSLSVTSNINSLTSTLTGTTSGVITIQPQAAAGTYNFNLPITVGSAGQVLTSQGGGSTAMTWTTPGTGTVTSVALTVPSFLSVSGSPITSSGTLGISFSGTALPVANGGTGVTTSTGSGSVVLSTSPTLVTPVLGAATGTSVSVTGNINSLTKTITGSTSGVIIIQAQANAGTYNFNLPITVGSAGQVLTSQGGISTAMTWTTPVTSVALTVPSFLSVSGSPITSSGTLAVSLSGTALPVLNGGTGVTTSTGSGSVVLSTSPTLVTPILGAATGTSVSVTGNINSLTSSITGSTSGVITIQAQANAGTYNFNLPITVGTAGQVLTSQGGSGTAMTWTTAGVGTVTSVALTVPSFLSVSGSPITSSGTLAVTLSGTALPVLNGGTGVTTSTGSGSVVLSTSPTLVTPVIGAATGTSVSVTGNINSLTKTITGSTSGVITIQAQANAGTYNFNLPITSGTAGQVLTSQGGSATAMTWTTAVTSVALTVPSFLSVSGSPITSSGTLAVTLSGTALPVVNGGTGVTTSTGSGSVVLSTSPTLVTPVLGAATGTSLQLSGLTASQAVATDASKNLISVATTGTGNYVLASTPIISNINANSTKITNVAEPVSSSDAATKNYVDLAVQGLSTKASVVAATTTNGTLASSFANGSVIDGVTLATGNRILIKDQSTQTQNGIYTVNSSGSPTRATDLNTGASAAGIYVFVEQGTVNADSGWVCTTDLGSDIVGTNNLVFAQFSGAGQIIAGTGLTKSGNTLSVNASQTQITAIGTIITGTWNATTIAVANGGTGVTTSTGSGSVVLSTSPTLVTPVLGAATGTSISVIGNINSLTKTITGSTSGVITIQAQANAGTYNFNLPITVGTAGQVLTSQGGSGTAMTWTTPSTGTVTSVALTVPTFLSVSGSPITSSGTLAVTLSGTALPVANGGTGVTTSTGSGNNVLSTSPTLVTPVLGAATGTSLSVTGNTNSLTKTITGSTSGVITIQGQAAAGTYNFNLPTTAGSAGQVLTSQGGTSTAMTWTTAGTGTVTSVALTVPSFLSVSGSPITSSGTLAVSLSGTALPVANGGTGATTLTSNAVLLGNGTGTIQSPSSIVYSSSTLTLPKIISNDTTGSTSSSTGSIIIDGGIGISNTTDATNVTNGGTFTTAGGMAIAKKLYNAGGIFLPTGGSNVGITLNTNSQVYSTGISTAATLVLTSNGGFGITIASTSGDCAFNSTTASTSTTTGAITLTGGIGISNTTDATSSSNGGTFTTAGGAAFAKSVYLGTSLIQTAITAPANPSVGTLKYYTDSADSLLKSKNSSGTVTTYQPITTKGDLTTYNGTTQTRLPVGTDGTVLTADSTQSLGINWVLVPGSIMFYIRDEKASGTNGGTATSGAFQTRTLNTITAYPSGNTRVTLSANIMTFTAGTYLIQTSAPAANVTSHTSRLFDTGSSTVLATGTSSLNTGAASSGTTSITAILTFASSTTVRLEHRVQSTANNTGFGDPSGFQIETYATVFVTVIV